jgi:hypothetical protein
MISACRGADDHQAVIIIKGLDLGQPHGKPGLLGR